MRIPFILSIAISACLLQIGPGGTCLGESTPTSSAERAATSDAFTITDEEYLKWTEGISPSGDVVFAHDYADPAQFQQPALPSVESSVATPTPQSLAARGNVFGGFGRFGAGATLTSGSMGLASSAPPTGALPFGGAATVRATTDAGDFIGSSPSILNLGIQHRSPIVSDPRVRGSRVGALAASGSYWVPARIDLDTAVSKIDSRIINQVTVIPGPYSTLYGPGFEFIDFELLRAPRYGRDFETHGRTVFDYRENGDQFYGRQSFWGGDQTWGFRFGYGHRTGSDYDSGAGDQIPSSYKSRDIDVALGAQLTPTDAIDFNYLRLDQTDVELAGQAFDIDFLVTDGYEVKYVAEQSRIADRFVMESWYNRTRFEGSAQRQSKRDQFPFLDFIDFVGFTDVDSTSAGYRAAWIWECCGERLTAGTDLRFVKQELNEITSGRIGFNIWEDANSPIPKSDMTNPGLFIEYASGTSDDTLVVRGGTRVDYVGTRITDDPDNLDALGTAQPQSSAEEILGSGNFASDEFLALAFLSADLELAEGWIGGGSVGYAERAPNLTERYAVETFMFLLQSGLNTVTGDPLLDKERRVQLDLQLRRETERFRGKVGLYHAWVNDYITFEALSTVAGPPAGQTEQVNLKYVNTDLATLWGCEGRAEYDLSDRLTPFATLKYVEGEDRSRNGDFATSQAAPGSPSVQDPTMDRGGFSGITGGDDEPLAGILPLESRLGIRLDDGRRDPNWGMELSCRIVDNQVRVAASLLETATPGFTTWDVRGYWKPRERLLLVAGVENFTDKQYGEHLDFRTSSPLSLGRSVFRPGVTFYAGATAEY